MSEKVQLKVLRCPTCGASLKAENQTDSLTCLFCGNTIVPVEETAAPREDLAGFSGTLKVEGIKTPSSALAYIEEFFEDYDWDSFTFAQSLSVEEIDTLANSLKTTSADDKSTWLVCFQAAAVPFIHKVNGWHKILDSVIEEYKQDSLDAYSKFDAYKRIAVLVTSNRDKIVANLEKIAAKAEKYGATSQEIATLQTDIQQIRGVALGAVYNTVEEIPPGQRFHCRKERKNRSFPGCQGYQRRSCLQAGAGSGFRAALCDSAEPPADAGGLCRHRRHNGNAGSVLPEWGCAGSVRLAVLLQNQHCRRNPFGAVPLCGRQDLR